MKDNADTKDIADGRVFLTHVPDIDDLGCHIARRPAAHEQILATGRELRQPEISNDQI